MHPFSTAYPGVGHTGIRLSKETQTCQQCLPALSGGSKVFPNQERYVIPPACSGFVPESPTSRMFPGLSKGRHLYQVPKQPKAAVALQSPPRCLNSSPYRSDPRHSLEGTYFGCLYLQSHSFSHCPLP